MGIVRRAAPDVVLAGGGFVSAPVALAARLQRVAVVATEADAHLGLANRVSGRLARRLCAAYPLPQLRLRQEVTGRPVDADSSRSEDVANRRVARRGPRSSCRRTHACSWWSVARAARRG